MPVAPNLQILMPMEQSPTPELPRRIRGIIRRSHSNLTAGLLLLSKERREDAFLFHDFCRLVDDIADDASQTPSAKRAALEAWLGALLPEQQARLPEDFLAMIRRRNLDSELLREIIRGMLMDTECVRFSQFRDLELYCRRVASAVGLVSARIFGAEGPMVERYAEQLGIALQLTNILRDVAEDAAMDRIYMPQEDLERFGATEEDLFRGNNTPAMTHLLNHQAERADSWFAKAELSWTELSNNQKRLMRPARLMSAIYREILLQMHRDRYDVFAKKYRVTGPAKARCLLRVIFSGN
jgi:phytoene synthase